MKKMITYFKAALFLLATLYGTGAMAQGLGCTMRFNPFTRTYTYLAGGIRLSDVETDEGYKTVPLGFTFRMGGDCQTKQSFTTVTISSNGWIKLGSASGAYPKASDRMVFPGLWPFYADMSGNGATVSYLTEMLSSGTKVFIVEWRNMKWGPSAAAGSISIQARLYEGSDLVEYSYKQESGSITPDPPDAIPGMIGLGLKAPTTAVTSPCPGYDMVMLKADEITTPSAATTILRNGTYGPNIKERPLSNQVFQFFQPCCGKPEAGFISQPDSVCPGAPFIARLSGATPSPFVNFGVRYKWEAAPSATGPWGGPASWEGSTVTSIGFPGGITTDTFLRVIVFCDSSDMKDTTPVHHIKMIQLPYNCYCYSAASNDPLAKQAQVNIGSMKLENKAKEVLVSTPAVTPAFANPGPYRDYTLFTGLRPVPIVNRDSTYEITVNGITNDTFAFLSSGVALFIDFDGDGTYHPTAERAAFSVISGTGTSFKASFIVPPTAVLGKVLGMRLIMKKGATTPGEMSPCNGYAEGETEDYLIQVENPKCSGPLSAGDAYITDTSICPGYKTMLWDINHARNLNGMNWVWQYSLDNVNWANLAGSAFRDTVWPVVMQSTHYRLRMVCEYTKDTIYSRKLFIKLKQPYKCYCYSEAIGNDEGAKGDSMDITTVRLNKFEANSGGPHLMNPASVRMRTDRTHLAPIELVMGETYPIAVYQTMLSDIHKNGKISVFMDFDHSMTYDAPSERIWTATTTATNYFVHGTVTIPELAIPDVVTGMRVILNANTAANDASDKGCGSYLQGETEDYLVIFRKKGTSVNESMLVNNFQVYPNPNNGTFSVFFTAAQAITKATLSVTSVTGQQVYMAQYDNVSNVFNQTVNIGAQAAGVYFVTLQADGQKTVQKLIIR